MRLHTLSPLAAKLATGDELEHGEQRSVLERRSSSRSRPGGEAVCPEQSVEDRSRAWETALENEGLVNKAAGEYVLKFDPRSGIDFEFLKSYGWEGLLRA